MKVAVSTNSADLQNAMVDSRFGRCDNYLIINTEDFSFYVLDNKARFEGHGAGTLAAQNIVNENVNALISGNVGPNAFRTLFASNVKIYIYNGSILNAIKELKENKLEEVKQPTNTGSRGTGRGMGQGRR
ncbi:MAG: NifB/NifX family molybdenum-iron cluster-binding protein [Candidatus Heimdallarchaeota archaeon]